MTKKNLTVIIAFDIDGKQIGSWAKSTFSNMGHLKSCSNYNKVYTAYQYIINIETNELTKRTWVKDIHGQLHEATGIKPVV